MINRPMIRILKALSKQLPGANIPFCIPGNITSLEHPLSISG
jgi:hypothetical protein